MTDKIAALLRQALEALEMLTDTYDDGAVGLEIDAIEALRAALAQPDVAEGMVLVPVDYLRRWQAAFAEELGAWDINPPLYHVQTSHDEIAAMLAAAPKGGA